MTVPPSVTLPTPSGELKVIVPVAVSSSPSKSEPSGSSVRVPVFGGSWPSSTTVSSKPSGTLVIESGASPMLIVSVAVLVLPSASTIV